MPSRCKTKQGTPTCNSLEIITTKRDVHSDERDCNCYKLNTAKRTHEIYIFALALQLLRLQFNLFFSIVRILYCIRSWLPCYHGKTNVTVCLGDDRAPYARVFLCKNIQALCLCAHAKTSERKLLNYYDVTMALFFVISFDFLHFSLCFSLVLLPYSAIHSFNDFLCYFYSDSIVARFLLTDWLIVSCVCMVIIYCYISSKRIDDDS